MSNTTDNNILREVSPGIFEGISPTTGTSRLFILIPFTDKDEILEASKSLGGFTRDAQLKWTEKTILEKNELIDGKLFFRCKTKDLGLLQAAATEMHDHMNSFRREREGSGENRK